MKTTKTARLLALVLGMCMVFGMLPQNSIPRAYAQEKTVGNDTNSFPFPTNSLYDDVTLKSLFYSVNGGEPVAVPDFGPEKTSYTIELPRDTPRNAVITLSGECTNENASILDVRPATLVRGVTQFESPASITVSAENLVDSRRYQLECFTQTVQADLVDAKITGIYDNQYFSDRQSPTFTISGVGMDNDNPVESDRRFRPLRWRVDDGAVLSGMWSQPPYMDSLSLSQLTSGNYTLYVVLYEEWFSESGWETPYQYPESDERDIIFVSFNVDADLHILTFDTDGGTPIPAAQTLEEGAAPAAVADPAKEGYAFLGWYDGETKVDLSTFTMPSNDVTLKARWEEIPTPPTAYTLTVENGTGSGMYKAGEQVSISAAPPEGKEFVRWELKSGDGTLQDVQSEQTLFTMADSDAVVTAVFRDSESADSSNPPDSSKPSDPSSSSIPSSSNSLSSSSEPPESSTTPKTGDDFPMWLFFVALLCLGIIGGTLLSFRRQKMNDK